MSTRELETRSRRIARTHRARREAERMSSSTPPCIHPFSQGFEQLVHTLANESNRALRDSNETRVRLSIDMRVAKKSHALSCFRPFRSIDSKLELHSYFDDDPATERLTFRDDHGLSCESFEFLVAERRLGPVPRFGARRPTAFLASAFSTAAEDSTGHRSGPAKYQRRAKFASRIHRRVPHAASFDCAGRSAFDIHSSTG